MSKVLANDLRKGYIIVESNGAMYEVITAEHAMTGKRTACVQVYMKGIRQGNQEAPGSARVRYMPDQAVECIDLVEDECDFLYMDGDEAVVICSPEQGCEQVSVPVSAEMVPWLSADVKPHVFFNGDKPVYLTLPKHVVCRVVSTETSLRHQRVTSSYKPAELDNGAKIQVPSFVKDGDKIIVNTEDFSYEGKAQD